MSGTAFRDFFDQLLGRGRAAVTVPPLDGALKPNNLLDEPAAAVEAESPDNLVEWRGQLLFSSGAQVLTLGTGAGDSTSGSLDLRARHAGSIIAMAASPAGQLALASDAEGLSLVGVDARTARPLGADREQFKRTTALTFADETTLIACVGSSKHPVSRWSEDLLTGGRTGSLWKVDLRSGECTALATGLEFPNGVAVAADGRFIVSESWQKRVVTVAANGRIEAQLIDDLPGYPGRISRSSSGYWLCIFAPRSQLIEFVLREPEYRKAMMKEVEPELWIAPALSSGTSVLEPMQGGALKQMGILKPWAPTLSYGLVVELDESFVPVRSLHSRAGGRRHGITSALQREGTLWVTSKGGGEVVGIDIATPAE